MNHLITVDHLDVAHRLYQTDWRISESPDLITFDFNLKGAEDFLDEIGTTGKQLVCSVFHINGIARVGISAHCLEVTLYGGVEFDKTHRAILDAVKQSGGPLVKGRVPVIYIGMCCVEFIGGPYDGYLHEMPEGSEIVDEAAVPVSANIILAAAGKPHGPLWPCSRLALYRLETSGCEKRYVFQGEVAYSEEQI